MCSYSSRARMQLQSREPAVPVQPPTRFKPTFGAGSAGGTATDMTAETGVAEILSSGIAEKSSHRKHADPTRCSQQKDGTIPSHVSSLWRPLFTFCRLERSRSFCLRSFRIVSPMPDLSHFGLPSHSHLSHLSPNRLSRRFVSTISRSGSRARSALSRTTGTSAHRRS